MQQATGMLSPRKQAVAENRRAPKLASAVCAAYLSSKLTMRLFSPEGLVSYLSLTMSLCLAIDVNSEPPANSLTRSVDCLRT